MKEGASRPGGRRRPRVSLALTLATLAVVIALVAVVYGLVSAVLTIDGTVGIGFTNADFIDASTDDPPGTLDPGYDKDVADCTAVVISDELVEVVLTNTYPSYTCTFTTTIQQLERLLWMP